MYFVINLILFCTFMVYELYNLTPKAWRTELAMLLIMTVDRSDEASKKARIIFKAGTPRIIRAIDALYSAFLLVMILATIFIRHYEFKVVAIGILCCSFFKIHFNSLASSCKISKKLYIACSFLEKNICVALLLLGIRLCCYNIF